MLLLLVSCKGERVIVGAEQTEKYIARLEGKRVGILTNHTGTIDGVSIVDSLHAAGVDLRVVFAPEHGFRGSADAGETVGDSRDEKTGIRIVSLYGAAKQPADSIMRQLDAVLFDMQDVGLRYYTYLSSLHYLMVACARNGVPLIVLDRPNPNGFYVDGPVLEAKHRSFVGLHPIPVVHGMTLGELAQMINGEGWLGEGLYCPLTVVPCLHYTHRTRYRLPVRPSPNLPDMRSVYLYPSLCFFEGTPLSIGRGTQYPFQVIGHPDLKGTSVLNRPLFAFTPRPTEGAKHPPLENMCCYGADLRTFPRNPRVWEKGVDLSYVVECYGKLKNRENFFSPFFDKLTGADYVREMIEAGRSADEIEAVWQEDVARFREQRRPYLLYRE